MRGHREHRLLEGVSELEWMMAIGLPCISRRNIGSTEQSSGSAGSTGTWAVTSDVMSSLEWMHTHSPLVSREMAWERLKLSQLLTGKQKHLYRKKEEG